jgi:hypothetical protein
MVNVGLDLGSILGLLQILGCLGYFVLSISQIIFSVRSQRDTELVLRMVQLIFAPFICYLLLSGVILFFDGWRLDPFLLFQEFLMSILIGYLIFLDWKRLSRTTQK